MGLVELKVELELWLECLLIMVFPPKTLEPCIEGVDSRLRPVFWSTGEL